MSELLGLETQSTLPPPPVYRHRTEAVPMAGIVAACDELARDGWELVGVLPALLQRPSLVAGVLSGGTPEPGAVLVLRKAEPG